MSTATTCDTCQQARRRLAEHRPPIPCAVPEGPPPLAGDDGPVALVDELASEAARMVRTQLGGHRVRQVWGEPGRVLFRLADGQTGDVELNWDVGTDAGKDEPSAQRPGRRGQEGMKPDDAV